MQTRAPNLQATDRSVSRSALVLAAALVVAALRGQAFLLDPRSGWTQLVHDRNGHYEFAQHLALSIRTVNPIETVRVLLLSKVWPPLHGICAAALLVVTGPDYRVAILPSLIAWVVLVVAAFHLTRELAPPTARTAAGLLAAAFVVSSPAYGHYSVDVMLESLGAALTAACVWMYVRARANPTPARWRALAIALLLLFLAKYNY